MSGTLNNRLRAIKPSIEMSCFIFSSARKVNVLLAHSRLAPNHLLRLNLPRLSVRYDLLPIFSQIILERPQYCDMYIHC